MTMSMREPLIASVLVSALLAGCTAGSFEPGTRENPRTVEVTGLDSMAFDPGRIPIRAGETVRFVVTNTGEVEHEFFIGTREQIVDHAVAMSRGGLQSDTSSGIGLLPGQTKELIHTFGSDSDIAYACLVLGHYPAGMYGVFELLP
jgi:uncharacterized cupredoxin-like copper-binding protein